METFETLISELDAAVKAQAEAKRAADAAKRTATKLAGQVFDHPDFDAARFAELAEFAALRSKPARGALPWSLVKTLELTRREYAQAAESIQPAADAGVALNCELVTKFPDAARVTVDHAQLGDYGSAEHSRLWELINRDPDYFEARLPASALENNGMHTGYTVAAKARGGE